jgi:hypothetical protein
MFYVAHFKNGGGIRRTSKAGSGAVAQVEWGYLAHAISVHEC